MEKNSINCYNHFMRLIMKNKFIKILILSFVFVPVIVLADSSTCPLGADVTKDLYGALQIFKIAGPLLVIGLTVYEGIISLSKGDMASSIKPFFNKFLKRMAAAIALFMVPVLVDVLMQLFNIWGDKGSCSLTQDTTTEAVSK